MFYTVITKSGWQGDFWRVEKTFDDDKVSAESYRKRIHQRADATQPHYNVAIKAHRKNVAQLLNKDNMIQFSDGTIAVLD